MLKSSSGLMRRSAPSPWPRETVKRPVKITINEGTSFLVCDESGDFEPGSEFGLYYEDTRFLSHYALFVDGQKPRLLTSRNLAYYEAVHYLTNEPTQTTQRGVLAIKRTRYMGEGMHEDIDVQNHSIEPVETTLQLKLGADFADIFEVKRAGFMKVGEVELVADPDEFACEFRYKHLNFKRRLRVQFGEMPSFEEGGVSFKLHLAPKERWHLCTDYLTLTSDTTEIPPRVCPSTRPARSESKYLDDWVAHAPAVSTDWEVVQTSFREAVIDLASLRLSGQGFTQGAPVPAAGLPWYMTFFGRDSLISGYQTLASFPGLAQGSLQILARHQGTKVNFYREEQPGKILHEVRFGELAELGEVPQKAFYATIDATPLWLIVLSETARWTGDTELVRRLMPNANKALAWIDRYGDRDKDGYVEYKRSHESSLDNQGWKDSFDSVRYSDGGLAKPPIALSEVQGYVYDAKMRMAGLCDYLGETEQAAQLREQASSLKDRFNRDFWMEDKGFYCEALDGDKRQCDVITSNPGHLLWSGILEPERALDVADRLLADDMFSGWGVRTMGLNEEAYNPISYHCGTVWPHDNSLFVAGLVRYGLLEHAEKVIRALFEATAEFPRNRPPELFCGYNRAEASFPVDYPTSSSPQAWASGAIILLATLMSGVQPNMLERKVEIRPALPAGMKFLKVKGIEIGGNRVDVEIWAETGEVKAEVSGLPQDIEVTIVEHAHVGTDAAAGPAGEASDDVVGPQRTPTSRGIGGHPGDERRAG